MAMTFVEEVAAARAEELKGTPFLRRICKI